MGIIGDIAGAAIGGYSAWSQRDLGLKAHGIEQSNLKRQDRVFNYQKKLQNRIFSREDTGIQRRVADLRKAGLSPLLAAGNAARAGAPIAVRAPRMETGGLQMQADALAQLTDVANVGRTLAETDLLRAQKTGVMESAGRTKVLTEVDRERLRSMMLDNKFKDETFRSRVSQLQSAAASGRLDVALKDLEETSRLQRIAFDQIGLDWQRELKKFVTENGVHNPRIVEFLAAELAYKISKYDSSWFHDIGQPSGGIPLNNVFGGLLGSLIDVFKRIAKMEPDAKKFDMEVINSSVDQEDAQRRARSTLK